MTKILCLIIFSTLLHGSVLEYFNQLPSSYFESNDKKDKELMLSEKRGAIIDDNRGYISAQGDGAQSSFEMCIWKSSDLLAVSYIDKDQNYVMDSFLHFYKITDGGLVKIQMSWIRADHLYQIPRYGKDIIEYDFKMNITAVIKYTKNKFNFIEIK